MTTNGYTTNSKIIFTTNAEKAKYSYKTVCNTHPEMDEIPEEITYVIRGETLYNYLISNGYEHKRIKSMLGINVRNSGYIWCPSTDPENHPEWVNFRRVTMRADTYANYSKGWAKYGSEAIAKESWG